jgi:hypothetical protein
VFVERCSAAVLDGLPDKMGDPGVPTISYLIDTQKFDQALCDLRVSMSIMPKVIYDLLNHDSLVPTSMHLQLADQSIRHLVGIAEYIPVRIRNSFVLVDFKLNISGKDETFTFKPKGTEQCNKVMVTIRPEWNAVVPNKKPSAVENFRTIFSQRIKNATSAATSPPITPVT